MTDERQWTLHCDARPPTANAWRNYHYHRKATVTREWREMFACLARANRVPHLSAIEVIAVPHVCNRRSMPDVGACHPAVKAAVDGLVDAGVIDDDTPTHVHRLTFCAAVVDGRDALVLVVKEVG